MSVKGWSVLQKREYMSYRGKPGFDAVNRQFFVYDEEEGLNYG
jgi:hypothetical protein